MRDNTSNNDRVILLAEDDSNDVLLIQRAFKKSGLTYPLKTVSDGSECIDYLSGKDQYADRALYPEPYLLILDLKMPIIDGFGVLQWARQHPQWKRLLIVVLTSSDCQQDVDRAYELGANSYLLKPVSFEEMLQLVKRFEIYWTEINRVPSNPSNTRLLFPQTLTG